MSRLLVRVDQCRAVDAPVRLPDAAHVVIAVPRRGRGPVLRERRDELVRFALRRLLLTPQVPEQERSEARDEEAGEHEHDDHAALDVRRLVHACDAKAALHAGASLESVSAATALFTRDRPRETKEAALAHVRSG